MSKERERVDDVLTGVRAGLRYWFGERALLPAIRVGAFPNQIVLVQNEREYTITITENRKSRLR